MTTPTNEPMTVEQYLADAEAKWAAQGRTEEQKWAVRNFMTGTMVEATTQINALIAKARLDELARGKEYVTKLRDVWLTQENKLDGEDPLAEKGIAIRNHLRDEIVEDFDARIAEQEQLLQKGEK